MKIVAENKKALFDYEILERFEAGIVLTGDEVKTLRAKQGSLKGSFAHFREGELYLVNANIPAYSHAYIKHEDDPTRGRKLLLHKKELTRLFGDLSRKGITIVPIKIYFNSKNIAKVELGIARHKKKSDKKKIIKERDIKRETARELKNVCKY